MSNIASLLGTSATSSYMYGATTKDPWGQIMAIFK